MNFTEALVLMTQNKYVSRETWDGQDKYCCLMPGMTSVWQILTQPNPNAGNYLFTIDDFLATDWKEITTLVKSDTVLTETSEDVAA